MSAKPEPGTVWIEHITHATCAECGGELERHQDVPGISGGITWFHPETSFLRSNGFDCPEKRT